MESSRRFVIQYRRTWREIKAIKLRVSTICTPKAFDLAPRTRREIKGVAPRVSTLCTAYTRKGVDLAPAAARAGLGSGPRSTPPRRPPVCA
eukprot:1019311-Rhodomonas_salina.1